MIEVKRRKKRNRLTRIPDLILFILQLIITGLFISTLFKLGMLNMKWLIVISTLLIILLGIFLVLMLMKPSRSVVYIKRFIQAGICAGLFFVNITAGKVNNTLETMTNEPITKIEKMSLIVLNDRPETTVEDLNGKIIGIQDERDAEMSAYVMEQMNINVNTYEYNNYSQMAIDLLNSYEDAILVNDDYFPLLEGTIDGFYGSYRVIKQFERKTTIQVKDAKLPDEPFTVYISGMDELGDPGQLLRSDVNILMLVDPKANHISMASIPRDSYVPNAALDYELDKLTHTGGYGIDNTLKTAENLLGFKIDYYAKISFSSVIEIINTIGGITVDVPVSFCEQNEKRSVLWEDQICLDAGTHHINGSEALALARHRSSYATELVRAQLQQEIIKAFVKQVITPTGLSRIDDVLDILPMYIVTDMPYSAISGFIANELDSLNQWTFDTIPMISGDTRTLWTASVSEGPQDVMLLSKNDVLNIYERYQGMYNPQELNDFKFDLNDMNKYQTSLPKNDSLVWIEDYVENFE